MQQIVTDCEEALPHLPLIAPSGERPRDQGRRLRAQEGYLYWADLKNDDPTLFQSAADAFQNVVDLGIYQLEDDMQELFKFENRNTASPSSRSSAPRSTKATGAGSKASMATA